MHSSHDSAISSSSSCQYSHDTGIHCGVECTFSMADSSAEIVSPMSLFTMVKSKKWPYACFNISDSLANRSRLPSYCNISQTVPNAREKGNEWKKNRRRNRLVRLKGVKICGWKMGINAGKWISYWNGYEKLEYGEIKSEKEKWCWPFYLFCNKQQQQQTSEKNKHRKNRKRL